MKMRNFLVVLALYGFITALSAISAFAFILPVLPPVGLPASGSGMVCRPLHLGADSYSGVNFYGTSSNLYVHSWSSSGMNAPCTPGTSVTGIAWRRMDPSNTVVLQQGTLALDHDFMDLEVTLVRDGSGNVYVIASYYKNTVGHFYRVYNWTPLGLSLVSTTLLNAQPGYSRISIDGCSMRLFTITWQQIGTGVRALAGYGIGVGLNIGVPATIVGSVNQAFPDVEVWNMAGSFRVSFVHFLNNNIPGQQGNITMSDIDFFTVHAGGAIAPAVLDVNPSAFAYWVPGTIGMWYAASSASLNLDRPDDHPGANWSYIYTDDLINIKARMSTGVPVTWVLNNGSIPPLANIATTGNYWPTIAFGNNGNEIYYGWYSEFPGAQFVAIKLQVSGVPIVPDYMVISNTTNVAPTPSIQFSKQNEDTRLFAAYSMFNPSLDYFINSKYIPWSFGSFKTTGIEEMNDAVEVSLYPNPFKNELNINLPATMQSQTVTISITDITGRMVDLYSGIGSTLNAHLNEINNKLNTGAYIIKVFEPGTGYHRTFKVQKAE